MATQLQTAQTINALYRKAADLANEAQLLAIVAPHSGNPALFHAKGAIARQEAYACSARAAAIQASAVFTYPGPAVLTQLAQDCHALETAIAASNAWTAIVAAGDKLVQSMPASSV
jgi:hypothetical protein